MKYPTEQKLQKFDKNVKIIRWKKLDCQELYMLKRKGGGAKRIVE